MTPLSRRWLTACGCVALAAAAGCSDCKRARVGKGETWVILTRHDAVPCHDAYLTWNDHDGDSDREQAQYVWNGHSLGRGDEGLREVLKRLAKMPKGSHILVYPRYPLVNGPLRTTLTQSIGTK
jgi:hypothetical protein